MSTRSLIVHLVYSGSRASHLIHPVARMQVDLDEEQTEPGGNRRRQ